MNTEKLELAAAKAAVGLLLSEEFSEAAVGALEDGCDSPALRILAGLAAAEADEARTLFDRVLVELNVSQPGKRDAVMQLARKTAEMIVNGATAPYQGAKQIWELTLRVADEDLPELDSFVYAASEWEDRPEDRRAFEDGIVDAARGFVSLRRD